MPTFWERIKYLALPNSVRATDNAIEDYTKTMNSMTDAYCGKVAAMKNCSIEQVKSEIDSEVKQKIEAVWQQGF